MKRIVQCYECGKTYDYDEDGFCPRCGAFSQPVKNRVINARGEVERADGLRETGHAHSFLHQEFHAEERARKRSGLEREAPMQAEPLGTKNRRKAVAKRTAAPLSIVFYVVLLIIFINFISFFFSF